MCAYYAYRLRMQFQFLFIRDAFHNTKPGMLTHVLGQDVSKALLGLHAFTGCDSVSAFMGIGKARSFKLLRSKNEFQVMFQNLGEQWSITGEMCVQLESFV